MLKNLLIIAWRNLVKNKIYGVINITGLAVGLAGFITILLYLNYELSYDSWDESLKKVYKVSMRTDDDILETTPAPLSRFLKQNTTTLKAATSIQPMGNFKVLLSAGDKKIYETGSVEADSSFFNVFPFKIINGDPATALNKPNAIVISEELSKKLFGKDNPIGKTIKLFNAYENEVTAVMELPGTPCHLNIQFVWRSPNQQQNLFWENYSYMSYVRTVNELPVEKLEMEVDRIFYNNRVKKANQSLEDFRKSGHQAGLFVEAISNLHNFPRYGKSDFSTVTVLLILAASLLLAGAINFSNLSIAASVRRAKEIGVRKVLGSGGRQLFWQFMGEIALQCLISLGIALLLVNIALPFFNRTFDINVSLLSPGKSLSLFIQIAICLLMVIILSGLYPALFLSRYNISKVLKGDYSRGTQGAIFRNSLMVIQFCVSAFFITGLTVIHTQMRYMENKDKGFAEEQVMRLETSQKTRETNFEITKNMLLDIPGVQYVSKTTAVPGDASSDTSTIAYKYRDKEYRMGSVKISADYFKTLQIKLLSGRSFNYGFADQNTRSAVINEAAAKKLNLKDPIGAVITFPYCDTVPVQIVGVVGNFSVSGFENTVQPVVFTINNKACRFQSGGAILVKFNSANLKQSVASIEQAWKQIEPDFPIRYTFLDENFQKLFTAHLRLQQVITFFGFTAILIAVMGLFALTAFMISQRTKEIGIRKILGANMKDIGLLLGKNFIRLIMTGVIIAIPVSWWVCGKWLQGFAYRINISWWLLSIPAIVVIAIAIIIIGIQTVKAIVVNPVKTLRID